MYIGEGGGGRVGGWRGVSFKLNILLYIYFNHVASQFFFGGRGRGGCGCIHTQIVLFNYIARVVLEGQLQRRVGALGGRVAPLHSHLFLGWGWMDGWDRVRIFFIYFK